MKLNNLSVQSCKKISLNLQTKLIVFNLLIFCMFQITISTLNSQVINLTSGGSSYYWDTSYTDGNADLNTPNVDAGSDILWATTFFLSTGGVNYGLINATTTNAGDTGNALFSSVNGAFDIDIDVVLLETNGYPSIDYTPVITNISNVQQTGSLIFYFDYDIGSFWSNTGYLEGESIISTGNTAEATGGRVTMIGTNFDSYQITDYADIIIGLENDTITNLTNTGSPLIEQDFTAAFQWNFSLAPDESFEISLGSVATPEPSTTLFIIMGIIFFTLHRRKNKF